MNISNQSFGFFDELDNRCPHDFPWVYILNKEGLTFKIPIEVTATNTKSFKGTYEAIYALLLFC